MQPEHSRRKRSRRKQHHEEEHEQHAVHDESNWLVSYADMMTLLFGFFVLMYSFSKIDTEKFEVVRKDMAKYFGGKLVDDPGAPKGMDKLVKDMEVSLASAVENNSEYNVKLKGDSLVLTLASDLLFAPGSAAPSEKTFAVLNKVYQSVKGKKIELIEVEGHTDSDAISTTVFPSNWELSTARAASIVRIFENLKVPSEQLKAAGYGASRLATKEKDDKGQPVPTAKSQNRRVVINFKIDPTNGDIKKTLEAQGLGIKRPAAGELPAGEKGPIASSGELMTLQEKYEAMNQKLQEAAARFAEAQARQKKIKDLESLSKKTEDMEKKISEMEKKTKEALEKTQKMMETPNGTPEKVSGKPDKTE